ARKLKQPRPAKAVASFSGCYNPGNHAGSTYRQLRLLYVQPRPVPRGARGRGARAAQRRGLAGGGRRTPPGQDRHLARPLHAERRWGLLGDYREGPNRGTGTRRVSRPSSYRAGLRWEGRARGAGAWQDREDTARRRGGLQGTSAGLRGNAVSLARYRAGVHAGVSGGHEPNRRRRNNGCQAQGTAGGGCAVPSGERPHGRWQGPLEELPGGL
ncbi:MAG: Anthranilate synthase, amidotransferase component @ Para-aminobenzoate synthase, amidotransferase component, partial [uncultured Rubrobacteraceae bacterium]